MSTDSAGIVLMRSLQSHNRVVILDRSCGKLVGITSKYIGMAGSVVLYHMRPLRSPYMGLSHVEFRAMPLSLSIDDLGFLHLLLEIVREVVPWNFRVVDVYQLLLQLVCDIEIAVLSLAARLVVLLKLCVLLGFYPNEITTKKLEIQCLVHMPFDELFTLVLEQEIQVVLIQWLRECITIEMGLCGLKTLGYLPTEKIQ